MPSSPLSEYLAKIGRIPLLTADEEITLGHAVQKMIRLQGSLEPGHVLTKNERRIIRAGERAKTRMIEANLRLVVMVSKKYKQHALNLEHIDLIQEGNIGLARAVEKFDPERGYKLSTYAFWWIRQSITRSISQQDRIIKLPMNAQDRLRAMRNMAIEFQSNYGRKPSVAEFSETLGILPETVRELMENALDATSLDRRIQHTDSNGDSLIDFIAYEQEDLLENVELTQNVEMLRDALEAMPERERIVLEKYYGIKGEPKTLQAIGREEGTSRERIRQVKQRALLAVRRHMANASPKKNLAQLGLTSSIWGSTSDAA